jgi:hypothetical protein
MLQYLVIVGAVVALIGASSYITDTVRGTTKPNRVTWLMWAVAPSIAAIAAATEGVTWAVVPVFVSGFGPLLIFLASFVNEQAYWKLTKLDYYCAATSLVALILWAVTKQPSVAIVAAILSDALAGVPTFIKCWKHPDTETGFAYVTALFSSLTIFAAIESWTFVELAFPMFLICANAYLSFAVYRKRIFST